MENQYPFLDPKSRVARNVVVRAQNLARTALIPGVTAEDISQELLMHLVRRHTAFDATRASYATFADRILANRIATMAKSTLSVEYELRSIHLNAPRSQDDGPCNPVIDMVDEDKALFCAPHRNADETRDLQLDVRRLIDRLAPATRLVALAGLDMDISDIPAALGLHRSTVHHHVVLIRNAAMSLRLEEYLGMRPTKRGAGRYVRTGENGRSFEPGVPGLWGNAKPDGNTSTANSNAAQGPASASDDHSPMALGQRKQRGE